MCGIYIPLTDFYGVVNIKATDMKCYRRWELVRLYVADIRDRFIFMNVSLLSTSSLKCHSLQGKCIGKF